MTLSDAATHVESPAPARRPRRRRILVALLLAVVAGAAGWWWSHPRLFAEVGSTALVSTETGEAIYLGVAWVPDGESIRLTGAAPRVLHTVGNVEVDVVLCRRIEARSGVGAGGLTELAESCSSVGAPTGRVHAGDQVLLEVVADEEAVVVVEGVDVSYATPYQRGTQASGLVTTIIVGSP